MKLKQVTVLTPALARQSIATNFTGPMPEIKPLRFRSNSGLYVSPPESAPLTDERRAEIIAMFKRKAGEI